MRQTRPILALAAVLAATTLAEANPITSTYNSSPADFNMYVTHGGIPIPWIHSIAYWDPHEWKTRLVIGEWTAPFFSDHMTWALLSYHEVAPHPHPWGQAAIFSDDFFANEYEDYKLVEYVAGGLTTSHGDHSDIYDVVGFVKLGHVFGVDFIIGYCLYEVGVHTDNPDACLTIDTTEMKNEILNDFEDKAGSTSMNVCPSDGSTRLASILDGIPRANLLGVEIHLGGYGQNGPAIVSMGGPLDWTEREDGTLTRNMTFNFPQQYMGNLIQNGCNIVVRTTDFPNGAIRGQCRVVRNILPMNVQILSGTQFSGNVASLGKSDDDKYTILSDDATLTGGIEVVGQSQVPQQQARVLNFFAETSAGRPGLAEIVSMYDYVAGGWGYSRGFVAPTEDDVTTLRRHENDAKRCISSFGQVLSKIEWSPVNDEDPAIDGWALYVDRAVWAATA